MRWLLIGILSPLVGRKECKLIGNCGFCLIRHLVITYDLAKISDQYQNVNTIAVVKIVFRLGAGGLRWFSTPDTITDDNRYILDSIRLFKQINNGQRYKEERNDGP